MAITCCVANGCDGNRDTLIMSSSVRNPPSPSTNSNATARRRQAAHSKTYFIHVRWLTRWPNCRYATYKQRTTTNLISTVSFSLSFTNISFCIKLSTFPRQFFFYNQFFRKYLKIHLRN